MINKDSNDWREVSEWAHQQIEHHRDYLENKDSAEMQTQFIRGQVAALRALLDLGRAAVESVKADSSYL